MDEAPSTSPTQAAQLQTMEVARSAATYAGLPMDVLLIVMRSVPVYFRIRHASCVCKRWRTAAFQTVTLIPHQVDPPAINLFPSLSEATIALVPGTIRLPTSLMKLTITKVHAPEKESSSCTFLSCPALTSISLPMNHVLLDALIPVLAAAASSLSSLEIRETETEYHGRLAYELRLMHFPALTSLSFPSSLDVYFNLLQRHASSLAHLSVPWRRGLRDISSQLLRRSARLTLLYTEWTTLRA